MILVTGATGTVGRYVVHGLRKRGEPVRAMTRNPDTAGLPDDVEAVRGVLADPATFPAALTGVDRVYLIAAGGSAAAAGAARDTGVRKIVLLSPAAQEGTTIGDRYVEVERAIADSGVAWTHLQPTAFAANTLWTW